MLVFMMSLIWQDKNVPSVKKIKHILPKTKQVMGFPGTNWVRSFKWCQNKDGSVFIRVKWGSHQTTQQKSWWAQNVLFDSTVQGRRQRSGQVQALSHTADTGTPSSHCFLSYPECGCPISGAAPWTSGSLPPETGTPCGPQVKQTKAPGKKTTWR